MKLHLKAIDTLFFGDGKPFTMGEESWANGTFPPAPSVLYGAMRSVWFAQYPDRLKAVSGKKDDPTRHLRLKKMMYAIDGKSYVPAPYDLAMRKSEEEEHQPEMLIPVEQDFVSSCPTAQVFGPASQEEGVLASLGGRALISFEDFRAYCTLGQLPQDIKLLEDCWTTEPKVGIGIDRQKTGNTLEGRLYRLGMKRMVGVAGRQSSFLIELGQEASSTILSDLPAQGTLNIGAEGKAMSYEPIALDLEVNHLAWTDRTFRLVLATPALFRQGWLPEFIDAETLTGQLPDGPQVRLKAAALGKPQYQGGWDMAERKPKPMRRAVPAGAVYVFELLEGETPDSVLNCHQVCISDERKEEGFGLAYIAKMYSRESSNSISSSNSSASSSSSSSSSANSG